MRIKYFAFALLLAACSSPNRGSIDNATILNWENESVTMEQFVRDHKSCLGTDRESYTPRSRIAKLIAPNQSWPWPMVVIVIRVKKYIANNMATMKYIQNRIDFFMPIIISQKSQCAKRRAKINQLARNRYPRRNIHRRYAPTVFDVVLRGTDSNERCPASLYSFDWNVTHKPSQSGIWAL